MNLTEFFFANFVGEYRFNTEKERELTTKAIEYIDETASFRNCAIKRFYITTIRDLS